MTTEERAAVLAMLDAASASIAAARAALGAPVTESAPASFGSAARGCPNCGAPAAKVVTPAFGGGNKRTCTACGWEG